MDNTNQNEQKGGQYNAEPGEIKDIVSSANMGIWRIELTENGKPGMYVDDTMKRLLGTDGLERSPEDTYTDWFSNITPDALDSVLASVERMKQGYFDENTYLWKHPSKGERYVRCGGTSKKIPGGYSLQGYHYDVDETVRRDQARLFNLNKALTEKTEYYQTLEALGDIFYSMHVINLSSDTYTEFNAQNEVKAISNVLKNASEAMKQVMNTCVTDEYKEAALEFADLDTLADRMQNRAYVSDEFLGKNIGWFLATFVVIERAESGRAEKIMFTTRIIDEEKKQKENLIHKTQTDEMTGLLNRRAYEEMIYEHDDVPEEDKFIYISLDANGLKQINDTLGHAAGDELITGVSDCMIKCFRPYGHVYRIGGDEFVSILFCDSEEIKNVLADFESSLASWKGKLIDELSVSYGWVDRNEMPDASTRQLGAAAEQRMYEAKSAYYRKKGMDRRGRHDAHKALCSLYTRILRINISNDTYEIISMDGFEQNTDYGVHSRKVSECLRLFGETGQVHPDDLDEYYRLTDLKYIEEYFSSGKSLLHFIYRRKCSDGYSKSIMEMVPANDYEENNVSLFLYIRDLDI